MQVLLYGLAVLAGLASPVQAGANAALQKAIHQPFAVGLVSGLGTVAVLAVGAAAAGQLGFGGKARQAPWWAWLSGLFGAVLLLSQPVVGAKLGAGITIGLTVTAATVGSIVIDHYGWLRFPRRAASRWRVGGGALMVAGVLLVAAG